jgi:hypothetical protein
MICFGDVELRSLGNLGDDGAIKVLLSRRFRGFCRLSLSLIVVEDRGAVLSAGIRTLPV